MAFFLFRKDTKFYITWLNFSSFFAENHFFILGKSSSKRKSGGDSKSSEPWESGRDKHAFFVSYIFFYWFLSFTHT